MDMSDHYHGGASLLEHAGTGMGLQAVALPSYNTPLQRSSLPPNKPDHHEAPQPSPSITRTGTPSTVFDRDAGHSLHGSPRSSISSFPGHSGLPGVPGLPIPPHNREFTRSPAIRAQSPLLKRSKTPHRSHRPQTPIGAPRPQSPLSGRPQSPLNSRARNSIANAIRPPPPSNLRQVESGDWAEKKSREDYLMQYVIEQAVTANRADPSSGIPEDTLGHHEDDHCVVDMHSPDSQDSSMSALTSRRVNEMAVDSDADEPSLRNTNSDENCSEERDLRALRAVLEAAFNINLGDTHPPQDILESVSHCLERLTLSLDVHRSNGVLVELPFSVTGASGDGSSTSVSTPAGSSDHSSPPASSSKRRNVSKQDEDGDGSREPDEGRDEDGRQDLPWSRGLGSQKKAKTGQLYPCPFRKREPLKFNYHRYDRCVKKPFVNMPELKKHINHAHSRYKFQYHTCPRCFEEFTTLEARDAHMRQEAVCKIRHNDRAPGSEGETVSLSVSRALRNRAVHYEWDTLWRDLFPNDKVIPKPDFEPLVELHEVHREHISGLTELRQRLHTALKSSLPENQFLGHGSLLPNEELCLKELENAVKEHVDSIFMKARANAVMPSPESPLTQKHSSHPPRETPSPRFLQPNLATPSTPSSRPSSTGAATSHHPWHTPSVNSGASSPTPLRKVQLADAGINLPSQVTSGEVFRGFHNNVLQPPASPCQTSSRLHFEPVATSFSPQLHTGTSTPTQYSQAFLTSPYGASTDHHIAGYSSPGHAASAAVTGNHQQASNMGNYAGQSASGDPNYDMLAQLYMNMNSGHADSLNSAHPSSSSSAFPGPTHGTGFTMGSMNGGMDHDHSSIDQIIRGYGHGVNGWIREDNLQRGGMSSGGGYVSHSEDAQFHYPPSG